MYKRQALAALQLGAGRTRAEDPVDPAVGIDRLVKVGDRLEAGAPLYRIHANSERALGEANELMRKAIAIGESRRAPGPLVDEVIG